MLSARLAAVTLALAATAVPAAAAPAGNIKLGSPFADHMVVQRDRPLRVWGGAEPGSAVAVRVGPRRATATADRDGRWEATLDPLPAGGPHALSASAGGATVALADVLVGDVWLCSGQSNMQMTLKESEGGAGAAAGAGQFATLRFCTVGKGSSLTPQAEADIRWQTASPEAALEFSAVGYYFAARLLADPGLAGVPVGVVNSSFGGTMCEAWVPADGLAGFRPSDLRDSMFGIKPSASYNGMIAPLGRSPAKGVVWYQGEGNAERPELYPKLLATLIQSWRERFETPDLAFVVVQLPDYRAGAGGRSWAWVREAQAKAVRATPGTALAVGINTHDGSDLHPKQKAEIGRRAALLALRDVYGRPVVACGPVFKAARPEGGSLRVTFDTAGDGLAAGGGPVRGFAVAGADGKYLYADATIDGDSVVLRATGVPTPQTVRYAWAGAPGATLANRTGLPAAPFRTDDLPPPDADVQQQVARLVQMKSYEVAIDGAGSVTSLGVGGKQFLSNALRGGGATVPGWFGPRSLSDIREPGPGLVSCRDDQVTLLLSFGEAEMEWAVTNRGKDGVKFRVALAHSVAVGGRGPGPLTLTRGAASLTAAGFDAVAESDDGPVLEVAVGAGETRRLTLKVVGR